jgi:hypothetical protein
MIKTITDLFKLQTRNLWLVTPQSPTLMGKIDTSPLGEDWARLLPFDNPAELAAADPVWGQGTHYPVNVYLPNVLFVFEFTQPKKLNETKPSIKNKKNKRSKTTPTE